jgi:hypothetical protein
MLALGSGGVWEVARPLVNQIMQATPTETLRIIKFTRAKLRPGQIVGLNTAAI